MKQPVEVLNDGTPFVEGESKAWRLVWREEFDKPGLPDPKVWGYERGMVRNKEPQCYVADSPKNAHVENSCLILEAHKERVKNPGFKPGSNHWQHVEYAQYSSASVTTELSTAWRYGRIEVRAKLPHAIGCWPAIWLLGNNIRAINWPRCGELDIMENWGPTGWLEAERIQGAVHYYADNERHRDAASGNTDAGEHWNGFHVHAIEWDEDKIAFFFDGRHYFTFELKHADVGADNPFRKPMYLLLNLALFDKDDQLKDSVFPIRYEVDYVRVYERGQTQRREKANG